MSDLATNRYLSEPTEVELLRTIFTYIAQISNERDIDSLLILLADMGRDLVTADRCTVWLVDVESGGLWSKVAHGLDRISSIQKQQLLLPLYAG